MLDKNYKVYRCNVENVSYGATCCAERVAIFKAHITRGKGFSVIAVVSGFSGDDLSLAYVVKVMLEFKIPKVIVGNGNGEYKEFTIEDLIPMDLTR